ncbi:MAG: serine/threonine-protein kinase [Pseudomonadota bacterium]
MRVREESAVAEREEDYAIVESLIDELLELTPQMRAVRRRQLAQEHPPKLLERLDGLLAADARLEGTAFMAEPAIEEPTEPAPRRADVPLPMSFDRYRVLGHLGTGGMGTVYLAEQTDPVERRVALKVTHAFDSPRDRTRFALEAQALARMEHPNIATLYDSGITSDGTPYVAMELVREAHTILRWCDDARATVEQRLRLFQQVCAGVAHAHEKGVLHRDLKPANVLVTEIDGQPTVRVIDFGIARAFSGAEGTRVSQASVAGSPIYMSPEAVGATGKVDLDTRSDVYSLGLLLCELISGELPFPADPSLNALIERLRSERSLGPADWLGKQSVEQLRPLADARALTPAGLQRAVVGDLDAIVLKAIAYDREQRYASPRDMARDIDRHLRHQPIDARTPEWPYYARRFIRRNRGAAAIASIALLTLVAFAATMTLQAGRIAAERDRANREAQAKGLVADFLTELFSLADPNQTKGETVTARELLDQGAANIENSLDAQPAVKAELLATMGDAYRGLALFSQAQALVEKALAARRALYGENHLDTLETLGQLGLLFIDTGRYNEAETIIEQTYEGQLQLLGTDSQEALWTAVSLAVVYEQQGRFEDAATLLEDTLRNYRTQLGDDASKTLITVDRLARVYRRLGRFDESEPLALEALAGLRRTRGEDDLRTLDAVNGLAVLYAMQGRYAESEPYFEELVELTKAKLGDLHPFTFDSMNNLAAVRLDQGRIASAEPLLIATYQGRRQVFGEHHPRTLTVLMNLGRAHLELGRHDQAEEAYLLSSQGLSDALGEAHLFTIEARTGLGDVYLAQGRPGLAEAQYMEIVPALRESLGEDHPQAIAVKGGLAKALAGLGRYAEADPVAEGALALAREVHGDQHAVTAGAAVDHARTRAALGDHEYALSLLTEAAAAGYADVDLLTSARELQALPPDALDVVLSMARTNAAATSSE